MNLRTFALMVFSCSLVAIVSTWNANRINEINHGVELKKLQVTCTQELALADTFSEDEENLNGGKGYISPFIECFAEFRNGKVVSGEIIVEGKRFVYKRPERIKTSGLTKLALE